MYMVREFISYARLEARAVRSILLYTLFTGLFILAIPFAVQILFGQYALLVFQTSTVALHVILFVLFIGISLMRIMQLFLTERLQRRIFYDGIKRAQRKFRELSQKKAIESPSYWNYVFETVNLQKSFVPLLMEGAIFALQVFVILILIAFYHPFFIVYSVLIALSLYFVIVVMAKKPYLYSIRESQDKYSIITTLQKSTSENFRESEVNELIGSYLRVREIRFGYYFRQSVGLLAIKVIAGISLLWVGGVLVIENQMTIGQLVAGELILINLLISLFKVTLLLDYWYDTMVGIHKLNLHYGDVKYEV